MRNPLLEAVKEKEPKKEKGETLEVPKNMLAPDLPKPGAYTPPPTEKPAPPAVPPPITPNNANTAVQPPLPGLTTTPPPAPGPGPAIPSIVEGAIVPPNGAGQSIPIPGTDMPNVAPPEIPEEIITVPTLIDENNKPKGPKKFFAWNTGKPMTDKQREIIQSGKSPDELDLDELREVYYHVTAVPGQKIYSATTVTYIEKHGIHPDEGAFEENESLFVGTEVHSAMETKGASMKRLRCYADIGMAPEKPETKIKLTKDHTEIIRAIAVDNMTPAQAYLKVKDNATTKVVSMETLMEYEKDTTIFDHEDPKSDEGKELAKQKKAVEKVINAGMKEHEKIKPDLIPYGKYLKDLESWEVKKEKLRGKGGLIIDDLDFISSSGAAGKRIHDKIQACYGNLVSNHEVMEQYYMEDHNSEVESHTELPILWKLQVGNKTLPAKSMLDKVHFDFKNKRAFVQDIKTHAKPAKGFVYTNYIGHKYFRSMSFYTDAVKYYLEHYRGVTNVEEWTIISVLLPISTISYEVGCYHPYLVLSPEDITMGKYGGFRKSSQASYFDENDRVQYALTQEFFEKQKEIGLIHERAVDKREKGWMEIVDQFERKFKPRTN